MAGTDCKNDGRHSEPLEWIVNRRIGLEIEIIKPKKDKSQTACGSNDSSLYFLHYLHQHVEPLWLVEMYNSIILFST